MVRWKNHKSVRNYDMMYIHNFMTSKTTTTIKLNSVSSHRSNWEPRERLGWWGQERTEG